MVSKLSEKVAVRDFNVGQEVMVHDLVEVVSVHNLDEKVKVR